MKTTQMKENNHATKIPNSPCQNWDDERLCPTSNPHPRDALHDGMELSQLTIPNERREAPPDIKPTPTRCSAIRDGAVHLKHEEQTINRNDERLYPTSNPHPRDALHDGMELFIWMLKK
jgi:hypothetical protein